MCCINFKVPPVLSVVSDKILLAKSTKIMHDIEIHLELWEMNGEDVSGVRRCYLNILNGCKNIHTQFFLIELNASGMSVWHKWNNLVITS